MAVKMNILKVEEWILSLHLNNLDALRDAVYAKLPRKEPCIDIKQIMKEVNPTFLNARVSEITQRRIDGQFEKGTSAL